MMRDSLGLKWYVYRDSANDFYYVNELFDQYSPVKQHYSSLYGRGSKLDVFLNHVRWQTKFIKYTWNKEIVV